MKIYTRFLGLFALAFLFWPQPASAMICFPQPSQDKVTCEIVICFRKGYPSSAGCRPALRESIHRVIWKRKSPIPWPTECLCSWAPWLLTPTTGDTLPLGAPLGTQGSLSGYEDFNQTLFKAPQKVKSYRKYAQASRVTNPGANDFVKSYGEEALPEPSETPAAAPSNRSLGNMSANQMLLSAINENQISTNCHADSFKRGRSRSCYMRTEDSMTTFNMRRVRSGFFGRTVTYYYDLVTQPFTAGEPISQTKMVFRNNTLLSCQLFVNGNLVSNGECESTSPYPDYYDDDEVFDDSNYDEDGNPIDVFDEELIPPDNGDYR